MASRTRADSWREWLRLHFNREWEGQFDFDQSSLALRAAREGIGVALVADVWVVSSLKRGTLTLPFGNKAVPGSSMYAVWEKRSKGHPSIAKLNDWLCEEINQNLLELRELYETMKIDSE